MIVKFKTKDQLMKFFETYLIRDEELIAITLLLDEDKMLQESN